MSTFGQNSSELGPRIVHQVINQMRKVIFQRLGIHLIGMPWHGGRAMNC